MTIIENIDELDDEVEWDLTIIENGVNQAIDTQDYDQALDLIKKGIEIARSIQHEKWMGLFQGLLLEVKNQVPTGDNLEFADESIKSNKKNSEMETANEKIESNADSIQNFHFINSKKRIEDMGNLNGVGLKTATLLKEAGISSIELLASKDPKELCLIKGIAEKSAKKYINQAKEYLRQNKLTAFIPETIVETSEERSFIDQESIEFNPNINNDEYEVETDSGSMEGELPEFDIVIQPEMKTSNLKHQNPDSFLITSQSYKKESDFQSSFDGDDLAWKESSNLIARAEKKLRSLGYFLLPAKNFKYEDFFPLVDIIAIKILKVTDLLEIVMIAPIKVSSAKGGLKISEKEARYIPAESNAVMNSYKEKVLVSSGLKVLKVAQEKIYTNIVEKGSILSFLSKYIRRDVSIKKSFNRKRMFLNSEGVQLEIVINPILITRGKVGFLENSSVPFAYQKNSNIHIVNSEQLGDLVPFLEKKHLVLDVLKNNDSFMDEYIYVCEKTVKKAIIFTTPFSLFGMALISSILLNPSFFFEISIVGIGLMCVMIAGLLFICYSFFQEKRNLKGGLEREYNSGSLDIDDSDLLVLADHLENDELLNQFAFECGIKTKEHKQLCELETKNHLKACEERSTQQEYNSIRNNISEELSDEMIKKYSKFLED